MASPAMLIPSRRMLYSRHNLFLRSLGRLHNVILRDGEQVPAAGRDGAERHLKLHRL